MTGKPVCQHPGCDNAAKEEYGFQFCGHHKEDYYKAKMSELEKQIVGLECEVKCDDRVEEKQPNAALLAFGGVLIFALGVGLGYLL